VLDGVPIGVMAAIATYVTASAQYAAHAATLTLVTLLAVLGAGTVSGSGAIVPPPMYRYGAVSAAASSIFLTTSTDIVSIGLLLGLSALMVRQAMRHAG